MSRSARKLSLSKIYHIMCKGIDGQDIFYDGQDKSNYLKKIENLKDSFSCKIFAYCLMSNHVHLVMQIEDSDLSRFMQSLNIRYTSYFNKKYDRSGHFFQDRFKSKCVENQKYFLDVCRYVHQNPEKAGICQTKDYNWSSYHEYIGKEKIVDKHILLHYFNENIDDFKKFTLLENSDNQFDFLEFEQPQRQWNQANDGQFHHREKNKFHSLVALPCTDGQPVHFTCEGDSQSQENARRKRCHEYFLYAIHYFVIMSYIPANF